ncbi:MAG: mRNA splicing protein prp28 [Watsoniomyces obsoletus]|nr:MAG: mRNA splicing protein prp28 [Watsoniomyces obsoletus]
MATQEQYVKLAQSLPARLLRFFQRYPPPLLRQGLIQSTTPSTTDGTVAVSPTLTDAPDVTAVSSEEASSSPPINYPNPFRSQRHPATGRWHDPIFSLRRQADLVKLARKHGVEELLPDTPKKTAERRKRREEGGLRVKGTGEGQRVKGKAWERGLVAKLEKRRQAMLDMPKLVQTWKERGHGRGWKKWPK